MPETFLCKKKKLSGKKMLFEKNEHAENELHINKNTTNDAENRRLKNDMLIFCIFCASKQKTGCILQMVAIP